MAGSAASTTSSPRVHANLKAQVMVRRGPATAWRRGAWGFRECLSGGGKLRAAAPLTRGRAVGAPLAPLSPSAAAPRCRPAAGCRPRRPPGSNANRQGSEQGCGAGGRRAGQGGASASSTRAPPARPPPPLTRVSCRAAAASRQVKWTALHKAAGKGHAPWFKPLLKAWLKALFRPWLKALALALADASLRTWVSDRAT